MPFHVGGNVQRANRGGQFDTRRKQRIEGDVDGARSGNELFHAGENGGRARLCGPLGRFRSLFHGMFHGALQRGEHPQGLVQIGELHEYAVRATGQESHVATALIPRGRCGCVACERAYRNAFRLQAGADGTRHRHSPRRPAASVSPAMRPRCG